MRKKQSLFDFIKQNYRKWPTNTSFAKDHGMSDPYLVKIIKSGYYVEDGTVYTPKGRKAFIDGVEFKIRGIE